jgi:hypothetical protein
MSSLLVAGLLFGAVHSDFGIPLDSWEVTEVTSCQPILRLAWVLLISALLLLYAERAHAVPYQGLGTCDPGEFCGHVFGVLDPSDSDYYLLNFSGSVLLDGLLTRGGPGDFDLFIYTLSESQPGWPEDVVPGDLVFSSTANGDEAFTGLMLPAAVYLFEVNNFFAAQTDDYNLWLETTPVPEPTSALLVGLGVLCLAVRGQGQRSAR